MPDFLPRRLRAGPLLLDLFHRDVQVAGRWLALHPREFALLWRLAEAEGAPVGAARLIADVWRLSHRPQTNSLAVHVSRLRRKLAVAGADGLLLTDRAGRCRLATQVAAIVSRPAAAAGLDRSGDLGEAGQIEERCDGGPILSDEPAGCDRAGR